MNRRSILSLSAIAAFGLALLPGNAVAQQSDTDKVKATLDAFHVALDALDIRKMDDVWAHDPDVRVVNPRDKTISIGWDAVRKNFEATFAFWSELKTPRQNGPHIHINGNVAWANAISGTSGKPKTGGAVSASTLEAVVLEKRADRWLIVSHSAWRVPQ